MPSILRQLTDLIKSGSDLLSAEATLLSQRAGQFGARLTLVTTLAAVATIGLAGIGAGVVVVLAPKLGAGPALLLTAGALTALSLMGVLIAARPWIGQSATSEEAEQKKARALRSLSPDAEPGQSTRTDQTDNQFASPTNTLSSAAREAVVVAVSKPDVIIGAAVALVGVLGVRRSIRLARFAASTAGAGTAILQTVNSINEDLLAPSDSAGTTHHPDHHNKTHPAPPSRNTSSNSSRSTNTNNAASNHIPRHPRIRSA